MLSISVLMVKQGDYLKIVDSNNADDCEIDSDRLTHNTTV
jgi:hypothetical protein